MIWIYSVGYWIGLIIAIGSLGLLRYGYSARKTDNHPLCAKCGYDLFGTIDRTHSCPECGTRILGQQNLRYGHRTRHYPLMVLAGLILISGLAVTWFADRTWREVRARPFLLVQAIGLEELDKVQQLIQQTPSMVRGEFYGYPWPNDMPPLHQAARLNQREMVEFLLDRGANVQQLDLAGMTALHHAAERASPGVVQILLRYEAPLNLRDTSNRHPIHVAATRSDAAAASVIESLLLEGADANATLSDGRTPLHLAIVHHGQWRVLRVLLERGADINQADQKGMTALHHAAQQWRDALIVPLSQAGADLNARDQYGDTPLHIAINEQHLPTVQALLRAGARVDLKDANDRTALQKAELQDSQGKITQAIHKHFNDLEAAEKNKAADDLQDTPQDTDE